VVRRSILIVLVSLSAAACGDPVRDEAIAALGPEAAGVRPGPLHRPGQPCLLCHDGGGGRDPLFSVAGTVYELADARRPLNKVAIQLIDKDGRRFQTSTNCAGNFFVSPSEYSPHYPMWVTMTAEDHTIDMESPVYRDGSCASCHTDPKDRSSAGHVFLLDEAVDLPASHHCQ
jgi:hypothetical protein